jgi:hypothetical protein
MELSETRVKRICEHYYLLKLLSIHLRVATYAMCNVVEYMTANKQRIFKLRVAAYSPTWEELKTATQIWEKYGKDLVNRANAYKAIASLLGGPIIRVAYESSLDQPQWGRKAKRKSLLGKPAQYAYRSRVNKADKVDMHAYMQMKRDFIQDLPLLKRTGVIEEFSQAITDFFVSFIPMMPDFLEDLAMIFPTMIFPKRVLVDIFEQEKNRLGTKKWEKVKMAARNAPEKDLREAIKAALQIRLNALIDIGETLNDGVSVQAPGPVGDVQHSPQAPLAPKHTFDTGGAGEFVGPNGIIYRLG